MIRIPMVLCGCEKCKKEISRPASDFDTDEKLVCETCGADYSNVSLYIKEVEENA
jgi:hypothetical protein